MKQLIRDPTTRTAIERLRYLLEAGLSLDAALLDVLPVGEEEPLRTIWNVYSVMTGLWRPPWPLPHWSWATLTRWLVRMANEPSSTWGDQRSDEFKGQAPVTQVVITHHRPAPDADTRWKTPGPLDPPWRKRRRETNS